LGDLLVMPTVGRPDLRSDEGGGPAFSSPFHHNRETAEAGYYAVDLDRYAVRAEMTSTTRVGVHRYTFEEGGEANVALDLSYNIYHHPDKNLWTFVGV
jgi:putative alpha-1,2-mannosidase